MSSTKLEQATSSLFLAENPNDPTDPHAFGVISIPVDSTTTAESLSKIHPHLGEMWEAYTPDQQQSIKESGTLNLSTDFAFQESYKDGVGAVYNEVSIKADKLSPAKEAAIRDWVENPTHGYGLAEGQDAIDAVVNDPTVRNHISVDMTVSGIDREVFLENIATHEANRGLPEDEREDLTWPLDHERMERIRDSVLSRSGSTSFEEAGAEHHDQVASKMPDQWPSPKDKNYGREEAGQGEMIYYTGAEFAGDAINRSGPYVGNTAWPLEAEYDEHGIARDEDGNVLAPSEVQVDEDFTYKAYLGFDKKLSGQELTAAVGRWVDSLESPPNYTGFDGKHCSGIASRVVFGEETSKAIESSVRIEPDEPTNAIKVLSDFRLGLLTGKQAPDGITVSQIIIDESKYNSADVEGTLQALDQLRDAPARQQEQARIIESVDQGYETTASGLIIADKLNSDLIAQVRAEAASLKQADVARSDAEAIPATRAEQTESRGAARKV